MLFLFDMDKRERELRQRRLFPLRITFISRQSFRFAWLGGNFLFLLLCSHRHHLTLSLENENSTSSILSRSLSLSLSLSLTLSSCLLLVILLLSSPSLDLLNTPSHLPANLPFSLILFLLQPSNNNKDLPPGNLRPPSLHNSLSYHLSADNE